MKKAMQIQGMTNGLVLHVQTGEGRSEGFIVSDDGSEAFKQFRAAFEAAADSANVPDEPHEAGAPNSEPHPEGPAEPGEFDGEFDEMFASAAGSFLNWLNAKERKRHAGRR